MNGDLRPSLFSRGIILVEGAAELASLPRWYEKKYGMSLDESNLMLYWVGSHQKFARNIIALSGFQIPWVIVCDGNADAIGSVAAQMVRLGIAKDALTEALKVALVFEETRKLLAPYGAFTVARSAGESLESLLGQFRGEAPTELRGADKNVALARWAAENRDCPVEVSELFDEIDRFFPDWRRRREQLTH
jgi:hypothetical protein